MIEHAYGLEYQWCGHTIFFGNRFGNLSLFKEKFPDLRFLRMKQVHGNQIEPVNKTTSDFTIEADGHLSQDPSLALCSISADCVPVLMACPQAGWIGAFHAGWRGVANRIIPLGIEKLIQQGCPPEKIYLWIGPHILQDSFEVQADVRDQILISLPPKNLGLTVSQWGPGLRDPLSMSLFCYEAGPGKFKLSLLQVLLEQISALDVPLENVEMELDDTLTNAAYFSARREKEASGRQISWIAKTAIS